MNFAFGYSRKSPDDKENTETSIKNQEDLIKTICKGKDWKLIEIFSDKDITGSDRERDGIKKIIKESKQYKVSNPKDEVYIVVKDQDRFARDSSFMRDTLKDLNVFGVQIFSIIKNDFLDYGNLGDSVYSLLNEQMVIDGRKKADILMEQKIEKGLPCIPAPFGYKYSKNKSWIIDKRSSEIVKKLILSHVQGKTMREITNELKINKSLYYRVLDNAKKGLYSGYVVFNKKHKGSGNKIVRVEEIKYRGNFEPLISEELFNKVNNK